MDNLVGVLIIVGMINVMVMTPMRTVTSNKLKQLGDATRSPDWMAWRLAILEPIFTTLVAFIGCIFLFESSLDGVQGVFIPPILSMLMFTWLIKRYGKGCQRGRLANSTIRARSLLLLSAMILFKENMWVLSIILTVIALIVRYIFTVYMSRVTPTLAEYEQERAAENIQFPVIEDGLSEPDLWDEQMALIDRLKGEESSPDPAEAIADQMVAEKEGMVGRVEELL